MGGALLNEHLPCSAAVSLLQGSELSFLLLPQGLLEGNPVSLGLLLTDALPLSLGEDCWLLGVVKLWGMLLSFGHLGSRQTRLLLFF